MTENERKNIIANAKDFFRKELFETHIDNSYTKASLLKSYNVNPFLIKYLACFLEGNDSPQSIAKALVYPRVLGTSINTSFGNKTQKMINTLFSGFGSTTQGIDIEFIDAIDGRKKYCQVKAGPNTINKDDVKTISDHFQSVKNLARTNNLDVGINDLVVGVLYGKIEDLSANYKKLNENFNVYIGKDFWLHLTGDEDFYSQLTDAIGEIALEYNCSKQLDGIINALADEISSKGL
ncbi:PmeII family type II restriction endonuclease [Porphyromonas cangingivalis]|uniref:PmeII family type II restriction endonuclease n=1 Tax=Porphyromonas cangingivalis TaxID=36874 RepID=UPI00051D1978|nr:PmeII family type II restriction endonuclease [Porphyromonas cangingivalis]KGL50252.1 MjaII restriction endonuclease [Porphyromonas cangingivalis]